MGVNSFIFLSFPHRHLGFVCRAKTGHVSSERLNLGFKPH